MGVILTFIGFVFLGIGIFLMVLIPRVVIRTDQVDRAVTVEGTLTNVTERSERVTEKRYRDGTEMDVWVTKTVYAATYAYELEGSPGESVATYNTPDVPQTHKFRFYHLKDGTWTTNMPVTGSDIVIMCIAFCFVSLIGVGIMVLGIYCLLPDKKKETNIPEGGSDT